MILKLSLPELDIHGPLPAMPKLASTVIPIVSIVSIRTGLAPLDCIDSSSSCFFLQCRIQNARLANACFASLKCSIGYIKLRYFINQWYGRQNASSNSFVHRHHLIGIRE